MSLSAGKTLVAVAAHADDVELHAGGFIAQWKAGGGTVHVVMMTNNCSGELIPPSGDETKLYRLPAVQCTALRHAEQQAACDLMGAQLHHMGYAQRHFFNGERIVRLGFDDVEAPEGIAGHPPLLIAFQRPEHIARLADVLVGLKPDLILTQTPIDLDPEHHAVASMVWSAIGLREELANTDLWFWAPGTTCLSGVLDVGYDRIIDISPYWAQKLNYCAAHVSQMTKLRWQAITERAADYGKRIGVRWAEPFKTAIHPTKAKS
jgi:LmbE family N-acetylglucosaminyl deacetylase